MTKGLPSLQNAGAPLAVHSPIERDELPVFVIWRDSAGRFHCKEATIRRLIRACAVG